MFDKYDMIELKYKSIKILSAPWRWLTDTFVIPIEIFIGRGLHIYSHNDVWWTERRFVPMIKNWCIDLQKIHNEIYQQDDLKISRWNHMIRCFELSEDDTDLWKRFYPEFIDYHIDRYNKINKDSEFFNAMNVIEEKQSKLLKRAFEVLAEDLYYWTV
jgi:hypothetical protein